MTAKNASRTLTDAQIVQVYDDLHKALDDLPLTANLNDKARLAIGICIENGIDTMNHIVSTLRQLAFDNRHAGAILTSSTGTDPDRYFWSRDKDGRYRNLDKPSTMPRMA